jgi:hypothetical protein
MGACCKHALKTLFVLATKAFDSGLGAPSSSSFDYGIMKVEYTEN